MLTFATPAKPGAGGREDGFDVVDRLTGLLADSSGDQRARCGVDAKLARDEDQSPSLTA